MNGFLEVIGVGGSNSVAQETGLHVHTATKLVGSIRSGPSLGYLKRLTGCIGHDCVYEGARGKPGVKAGAIENIHRRLGKIQTRTLLPG